MTDPATLHALAAHQDAPAVRQALEAAAQRIEVLEAALRPFSRRKFPETYKTLCVSTDDIRAARKALEAKDAAR